MKSDIVKSLSGVGIDVSEREVGEMLEFANAHNPNRIENAITRDDFKKFFIS